ncbi:MAG: SAM-dependent methyltransferase [Prosthecobacter sp.]|jgi:SAM-dependent MidA family methyltransferase|uniref:SAM-dependent methyltransferase n=1 Tax=Prosthecobacter sp. TaxID=1965333 RepID=UPI0019DD1581|nr:SAM-dependent methyltransferase [Prosthecobacter sp.]MBE2282574.1 SAM-dependent methyltransferase [Prosthecobacter sp.]
MARALFDPERGYYTRHIQTVGARGDFSTSATLSPSLGAAIAAWIKAESRIQPRLRHVIEIGAGDGSLMHSVRKALGWWTRRRFTFHIVETSPVLREQQQKRLGSQVHWHTDIESALAQAQGHAFIYHNELLDAFPATLVQWSAAEQRWFEVWVPESLHPHEIDAAHYSVLRHTAFKDGQRCEMHPSIRDWLRNWTPQWKGGAMLSIDYGDEFPQLYHRRPHGTLRAYLLHQRLTGADIYANPGRQDITADINFTDYAAWLREFGATQITCHTLADLLRPHGAPPQLLDAEGAGSAFKCLVHRPQACA